MVSKRSALDIEWSLFRKKEQRFLADRAEKKDTFLNKKLAEKVPEKLQGTLDSAFAKAFALILKKGQVSLRRPLRRRIFKKVSKSTNMPTGFGRPGDR